MVWRSVIAFLVGVLVWGTWTRHAWAWVEWRVTQDDIEVRVDKNRGATVAHRIVLLVSGGPLHELNIVGVDADAVPEPDEHIISEKDEGQAHQPDARPALAARVDPTAKEPLPTLRVQLNGTDGIRRGAYVLRVRYRTSHFQSQGSHVRSSDSDPSSHDHHKGLLDLTWTGPEWREGLDATKVTFVLPNAPTAPQAKEPSGDDLGTILSSVRRRANWDELEMVRAYAPKGSRVSWSLFADAKAFDTTPSAPQLDTSLTLRPAGSPSGRLHAMYFAVAVTMLTLLSWFKDRELRQLLLENRAQMRPLIPLSSWLRIAATTLFFGAGLVLQMLERQVTAGTLCVLFASALAVQLPPRSSIALRGQGEWLSLTTSEALRPGIAPRVRFDTSTSTGKCLLLAIFLVAFITATLLWDRLPSASILVVLDSLPFVALLSTGRLDQLPPDLSARPIHFYRRVAKGLEQTSGLRVVPRARIAVGSHDVDELRLGVAVSPAPPGLRAVEIGVFYAPSLGTYVEVPEVILRCDEGADVDRRLHSIGGSCRISRGRRANERAYVFSPRLPNAAATVELLQALAKALQAPSSSALKSHT